MTELKSILPDDYTETVFEASATVPTFDECTEPIGITSALTGKETPVWFFRLFLDDVVMNHVVMNHIVIETKRHGKKTVTRSFTVIQV